MMREFQDKKSGFEKVCHGLLQVLLVYIARKQNLSVISDSSFRLSKECALAKRYIDINYSQNITLDSLAEITHINKFYLAHSFTECIGQSPRKIILFPLISLFIRFHEPFFYSGNLDLFIIIFYHTDFKKSRPPA